MKFLFYFLQIMLLLLNLCVNNQNGISDEHQLVGSWAIYAGGTLAPELMVFSSDGSGKGYGFTDDYEETWLNQEAFDPSFIDEKLAFSWQAEPQNETELFVLTIYYENGTNETYQAMIESNVDGTNFLGLSLFAYDSGATWIKIPLDPQD